MTAGMAGRMAHRYAPLHLQSIYRVLGCFIVFA
jgi:hypothetical protein